MRYAAGFVLRSALLLLSLASGSAQRPDPGPGPRPNAAREAALLEIMPVTTGVREDDHPAAASRNGIVWTAWVSYSEAEHAAQIFARRWESGKWSAPERVTPASGDYHKPAIAIDASGAPLAVWPSQQRGNWDLYLARRNGDSWSAPERLTTDAAPDLAPQLAASGNRAMLVWQSLRNGSSEVLHRLLDRGRWSDEARVSEGRANAWEPVVAATADGAFHVAWDSYRGDYDVLLRTWRAGKWDAAITVAGTARLENHAALTSDSQNRVWIAWETGPENWAADSANDGLRPSRGIGLACLANGRLHELQGSAFARMDAQAPVVHLAGDGVLRLFFREPMNKNWLRAGAAAWSGAGWSEPDIIEYTEGRIDQRIVTVEAPGNRVMALVPAGSSHNIIYAKLYGGAADPAPIPLAPLRPAGAKQARPREARHTFRGHTVVWGDLHRHTDISEDGGIPDGSLMDAMRYSLDAAGLDFLGITDHTRYLPRRYNLYRIQQVSDLLYRPGHFVPLHAYERSQYTPWGHRNVVYIDRGHTPVPAAYDIGDAGVSPWGLFDALRGQKAMSIPHTSAWGNKQVSWDYFDPQVERLVEIYQGLRSTYEYNGAPDPAGRQVYEKDSKNFIWDALARGRKLGFIASSDHRSTHMSFAAVYVKNIDRESIFEGLAARRTYAATDKILIEFAIGNALMGEETTVDGQPEVEVAVTGTAGIARVDVIRDGAFAYTTEPKSHSAKFRFRDTKPVSGESYYYVRVIQEDKNMAWASPIWVKRR
jgi:hypothetical protein